MRAFYWRFWLSLLAIAIVVIVLLCWLYTLSEPPCQPLLGDMTGTQHYDGHEIQCFHGQVVKVQSG